MHKCSYCGRENDDSMHSCSGCGTALAEPPAEIPLRTPDRMMGDIQSSIWEYFAVKRRNFYFAAFLIGSMGGLIGMAENAHSGFHLWALPAGGALGVSAVWLLSFAERLQSRIQKARAAGKPTSVLQGLFVILGLIGLIAMALLVAGIVALLL